MAVNRRGQFQNEFMVIDGEAVSVEEAVVNNSSIKLPRSAKE